MTYALRECCYALQAETQSVEQLRKEGENIVSDDAQNDNRAGSRIRNGSTIVYATKYLPAFRFAVTLQNCHKAKHLIVGTIKSQSAK